MSQTLEEIAVSLGLNPETTTEQEIRIAQARELGDLDLVARLENDEPMTLGADLSPAARGDTSPTPADATADAEAPREPKGKLKIPDDPKGLYVVLWAPVPERKRDRPTYQGVDVVAASGGPGHAKRIVMGDSKVAGYDAPFAPFLMTQAKGRGILLRAVPAMHWPAEVEATTYVQPAPVLTIR